MTVRILHGDALSMLRTLPAGSARCCVTSPPYFGLRDYGVDGQIGLEGTPEQYVANLVAVFRELRRVLRDDGTLWLNLGDSYYNRTVIRADGARTVARSLKGEKGLLPAWRDSAAAGRTRHTSGEHVWGLKEKDRLMIPARVALALQADGWWLRDEIVWHKPRTTPFPANDRTVSAHEMVYLLSKSARYFFDWAAIEEPSAYPGVVRKAASAFRLQAGDDMKYDRPREMVVRETRRSRSVWSINPQPYKEAHFATMPQTLAERCLLAGSAVGDTVLDPFGGAGTTALAATRNSRSAILVELNPAYCALARRRLGLPATTQDRLIEIADARTSLTATFRQAMSA